MLKIALTGGICSGKSLVATLFSEKNIPVIDADLIAHQITAPNTPLLRKIISYFGEEFLIEGALDRKKLKEYIFYHENARIWLEKLLHPEIIDTMQHQVQHLSAPYVIFVIPLLAESAISMKIDRILVVDVSENIQKERLAKRDHLSCELIDKIISAQSKRVDRLKIADDVIENTGDIAFLKKQVDALHQFYLEMGRV